MTQTVKNGEYERVRFKPADVPKIRVMVMLVEEGVLLQDEAAVKYKTTRHQARKFLDLYAEKFFDQGGAVPETLKEKIIDDVFHERYNIKQEAYRYKNDADVVRSWGGH